MNIIRWHIWGVALPPIEKPDIEINSDQTSGGECVPIVAAAILDRALVK
jgi:hypothetical protein